MKQQVILKKWRARIERAEKRGYFTDKDKHDSYDWAKCAVGERDCMCEKVIPKDIYSLSKHDLVRKKMFAKVVDLGGIFHSQVHVDNFKGVLKTLEKIETLPKKRFYR